MGDWAPRRQPGISPLHVTDRAATHGDGTGLGQDDGPLTTGVTGPSPAWGADEEGPPGEPPDKDPGKLRDRAASAGSGAADGCRAAPGAGGGPHEEGRAARDGGDGDGAAEAQDGRRRDGRARDARGRGPRNDGEDAAIAGPPRGGPVGAGRRGGAGPRGTGQGKEVRARRVQPLEQSLHHRPVVPDPRSAVPGGRGCRGSGGAVGRRCLESEVPRVPEGRECLGVGGAGGRGCRGCCGQEVRGVGVLVVQGCREIRGAGGSGTGRGVRRTWSPSSNGRPSRRVAGDDGRWRRKRPSRRTRRSGSVHGDVTRGRDGPR